MNDIPKPDPPKVSTGFTCTRRQAPHPTSEIFVFVDDVEICITFKGWKGRSAVIGVNVANAEGKRIDILRGEKVLPQEGGANG